MKFLHEVFLDRHLSIARAHVRGAFLTYWSEIDQAFDEVDGDAELVKRILTDRWSISTNDLESQLPAIIAKMTGYPMGRLGRYTRTQTPTGPEIVVNRIQRKSEKIPTEETLPQRVVLRGFRRTH